MTFKMLGAVLIVFSSWVTGFIFSMNSRYRLDDLEELKKAVTLFINDAVNISMPLGSVFEDISKRINGSMSKIFYDASVIAEKKAEKNAEDIFKKVIDINSKSLYFQWDDMELLYTFAKNLDCPFKNQQKDNALLLIDNIKAIEDEVRQKSQKERKLYNSAGVLCGILISVILF